MTNNPETPCTNCNGKGYNTRCFDEIGHKDFGGDGYKKRGLVEKVPCKKCSSATNEDLETAVSFLPTHD